MLNLVTSDDPPEVGTAWAPESLRDFLLGRLSSIQQARKSAAIPAAYGSPHHEEVTQLIDYLFYESPLQAAEVISLLGLAPTAKKQYPLLGSKLFTARASLFAEHPDVWAEVMAAVEAPSARERTADAAALVAKIDALLRMPDAGAMLSPEFIGIAEGLLKVSQLSVGQLAARLQCDPAVLRQGLAQNGADIDLLTRPDLTAVSAAPVVLVLPVHVAEPEIEDAAPRPPEPELEPEPVTWQALLAKLAKEMTPMQAMKELRAQGFPDIPAPELREAMRAAYSDETAPQPAPQPAVATRRTLIDTSARAAAPPTTAVSLADSRPGPNRHEMDWLATQLQASPADRASGAVEEFDAARFERVFLPWVVERDKGLRDQLVELVHEYMNPALDTEREYGYPFPISQLPGTQMPTALAATLSERKAWIEKRRAHPRSNPANAGRLTATRIPLQTIGANHSVDNLRVLGPDTRTIKEWDTVFPGRVVMARDAKDILTPGAFNSKLGNLVVVGGLRGFEIMTINLVPRKTCDIGCTSGDLCFDQSMSMATRIMPDETYYDKFRESVRRHRDRSEHGIMIRAHTLGDFYDPEYVDVVDELIAEDPGRTDFWIITERKHSRHPMAYLDPTGRKKATDVGLSMAIGDQLLALQFKWSHNVQLWFSSQLPLPGSFVTLFENPLHFLTPEQQKPTFMKLKHGIVCPAEIEDPVKAARIAEIHAQQRAANPNIVEATLQGATGRLDTCGDCGYSFAPRPGRREPVIVTVHGPSVATPRS